MKIYRNEQLDFEIDIPEVWFCEPEDQPKRVAGKEEMFIFRCRPDETFNLRIEGYTQEPDLSQTEAECKRYVQEMGHTSLCLGRFTALGKEHVWARYYEGYGHWTKKYVLCHNRTEFTFTAACVDQRKLLEMERDWDAVVTSFRDLKSVETLAASVAAAGGQSPAGDCLPRPPVQHKPGTKTYLNEKHSFEIDLPENWAPAPEIPPGLLEAFGVKTPPGLHKDVFQYGCYEEAMNFEIAPLFPEPMLEDTVVEFKVFAQSRGFKDLHLSRITVGGKEHVCANYFIEDAMGRRWNKKYMLVFGGIEYALTCTCNDPLWFIKRDKEWDAIIQTFHVLKEVDDSANATPQAEKARQTRREYVQMRQEMLQNPRMKYARACEAMAVGNYPDARFLLEEVLQTNPNHLQAHKDLARLLEMTGDQAGAIQHLQVVERLDPSDSFTRSNLARLGAGKARNNAVDGETDSLVEPFRSPSGSVETSSKVRSAPEKDKTRQGYSLAFSIFSYLFIDVVSIIYFNTRSISLKKLLFITSASHASLSAPEYDLLMVAMIFGIGALICLVVSLGLAINEEMPDNALNTLGFIQRTMRANDFKYRTLGGTLFSDYTRKPGGIAGTTFAQVKNILHAFFKILAVYFSVSLLPPALIFIFLLLLVGPEILRSPMPLLAQAGILFLYFGFCYRAVLFGQAKTEEVSPRKDPMDSYSVTAIPSLEAKLASATAREITLDLIREILQQKGILTTIQNDLARTDQIGFRELWRLGLITPERDIYDLSVSKLPLQERLKKIDANTLLIYSNQISFTKIAVLFDNFYFNIQFNNLKVTNNNVKPPGKHYSSYYLRTQLNRGEFIRLRNIQIDTDRPFASGRSAYLAGFLREEGFPLKEFYREADPLSTERGGVIVLHQGSLLVIHPEYFVQRRLIDDEGNLVDLGIDEDFALGGPTGVKIQPAVMNTLVRGVASKKYTPILRYHSVPYASEVLLPLLDTPVSMSGWADLYICASGKAMLFVAQERPLAVWEEMMNKLKQLFLRELSKKGQHILGMTRDGNLLRDYLRQKQDILKEYYSIEELQLF